MRNWGKAVSRALPKQWELVEANISLNTIMICGLLSSKKSLPSYAKLVSVHLPEIQWNYWEKIIKNK